MARKSRMDLSGASMLIGFSVLLAYNQVVIAVVNDGYQPVFAAGIRSVGAVICLLLWFRLRGDNTWFSPGHLPAGLLIGTIFSFEFIFLFTALDLTTVVRTSVIFYTMPLWLALASHFLLPGERITPVKGLGLILAFGGVALAILQRGDGAAQASLWGDLCALGAAWSWAGIALCARGTSLVRVTPKEQLLWQVAVSAPILLIAAFGFGDFLRAPLPIHLIGLLFQIVVIVSAGYLLWLWLISVYPVATVASFSFLSPVFGVGLGWLLLDEPVGWALLVALVLVAAGILLINRPARA